jgi:hypothetical protein
VSSIRWNSNGARLASAGGTKEITIWNPATSSVAHKLTAAANIDRIIWSHDNNLIAGNGEDGRIYIWSAGNPDPVRIIDAHDGKICCLEFSPDGRYIASGGNDGYIRVWNTSDWTRKMKYLQPKTGIITALGWAPAAEGQILTYAHSARIVESIEINNEFIIQTFDEHDRLVTAIEWSPDGNFIALGGNDETIRLWNSGSEKLYYEFTGHIDEIKSIDWCNDHNTIISSSYETRILKWSPDDIPFEAPAVQQDSSDGLWSIVRTKAKLKRVDMGSEAVGKIKDTIVSDFFINTGTVPVGIEVVNFSDDTENEFEYLSPPLPFVIPPGDTMSAELRFAPKSAGAKNAEIYVLLQDNELSSEITGTGVDSPISLVAKTIDFGDIPLGRKADTVFAAIKNAGSAAAQSIKVINTGPDKEHFNISTLSEFTLAAGESRTFSVEFDAGRTGAVMGGIEYEFDGAGSPLRTNLYANVIAPEVIARTSSSFLPLVCPGNESAAGIFIRNIGSGGLHLYSATITGPDASDFELINSFPDTLVPSESREYIIDFIPESPGDKTASLLISTNIQKTGATDISIPLSATKDSVGFTISESIVPFTDLDPDTEYSRTFSILNTGTVALSWDSPIDMDKFLIEDIIPAETPAGGESIVTVVFRGGSDNQQFQESYEFEDICGNKRQVGFTAFVGKDEALISAVESIEFPTLICEEYKDTAVSIKNIGSESMTISDIGLEHHNGNFSISATFSDWIIAPDEERTIDVRFVPHSIGDISETLIIESNAINTDQGNFEILLTGRKEVYEIELSPDSLYFEAVQEMSPVRMETIVTNTGTLPYDFDSPRHYPDFTIESIVPSIIPPAGSGTITVTFEGGDARQHYNEKVEFSDSCGNITQLPLAAYVVGPSFADIMAGSAEARPGDTVRIPVMIKDERYLWQSGVNALEFNLVFNKTLLYPVANTPSGRVEENLRIVPMDINIPAEGDYLLAEPEFLVMLGDTNITEINIKDAESIGDIITLNTLPGTFTLISDKNYKAGRRTILHQNEPNPAAAATTIRYELGESGPTELALYDLFGRKLRTLDRGIREQGEYEVIFNSIEYPVGSYYIILRTASEWQLKKMIIIR